MADTHEPVRWTQEDVDSRLEVVRSALLDFLRERTRLDWFRHKVRWRLSRQFIWPGAPDGLRETLDAAVEKDGAIEALMAHIKKRRREISEAIEHYNVAVRRLMEQELGVPTDQFAPAALAELRQRRITFQGIRDELLRRARQLTPESGQDLLPELLSLRLAILNEDVRDELFSQVGALVADEVADATPNMTAEERDNIAEETEIRLRCLDRQHVVRLLAENYAEARQMMDIDGLMSRYEALCADEAQTPEADGKPSRIVKALRGVLVKELTYLEELYPETAGTDDREMLASLSTRRE